MSASRPGVTRKSARYAEESAEHKVFEARLEGDSDENEIEDRSDDLPEDVPPKAV